MAQIPSGGGGGSAGGSGWVKVADVDVPGGSATSKVYQDPGNDTILQSVTVSDATFDITVRASYPLIEVDGTPFTLPESADGGHYQDTVQITVAGTGPVTVTVQTGNNLPGAVDAIDITVDLPAVFTSLVFSGPYPTGPLGLQTEVKAGDTFDLTWTSDKNIDAIQTTDFGALDATLPTFAPAMSGTVTVTVANRGTVLQLLSGRARPRDAVSAALGPERDTNLGGGGVDGVNVLSLNNLFPTNSLGTPTNFPGAQTALKGSETADVPHTAANFDAMAYTSPNGDLSIASPATYQATKVVTRIAGSYNITTNNIRAVATRGANGAQNTSEEQVQIANVAATLTASFSGARVRSGPTPGNDTPVTISGSQQLLNAPSMDPAVGFGTFLGGGFTGGPVNWIRSLRVPDSENPTTGASHAWLNVVATNLAGIVTNAIGTNPTYVVGGATARTVNYAAFTRVSTETFPLTTEGNLTAIQFSNGNPAVIQPFGTPDTNDVGKEGWVAPTGSSGNVNMRMLHTATGTSHSGLTLTGVEETA